MIDIPRFQQWHTKYTRYLHEAAQVGTKQDDVDKHHQDVQVTETGEIHRRKLRDGHGTLGLYLYQESGSTVLPDNVLETHQTRFVDGQPRKTIMSFAERGRVVPDNRTFVEIGTRTREKVWGVLARSTILEPLSAHGIFESIDTTEHIQHTQQLVLSIRVDLHHLIRSDVEILQMVTTREVGHNGLPAYGRAAMHVQHLATRPRDRVHANARGEDYVGCLIEAPERPEPTAFADKRVEYLVACVELLAFLVERELR
ncbi:hypothetical protein FI667_g7265, partial [Globisporangium splendens]